MAGSVNNKEYDVTMQIRTDNYAEEIESLIREVLEEVGIIVVNVNIEQD